MGPRPHLSLCACKTTRLTSELLVSMGPSLHLGFLHAKLRLYDQNYKSLWFPGLICCLFCFHNSVIMTGINSLLCVPAFIWAFCTQNCDFMTRITSLYWSHTSSMVFCTQNRVFSTRIASLYGSQPSSVVFFAFTTSL